MNMSMMSGVLALRANTAMAHAANTGLALNRKTAETNANAPEQPLDFWTPSILILRTGGDDGEAEFQRGLQA